MESEYEQHQQQVFPTIIKWTCAAALVAVLVNSYFLWSDFWPTVLQNALALAFVAVGVWCLRLSRRDEMRRAVRIYLVAAMILAALFVSVLSEPFLLNGVLALALLVFIATYVESPDRALWWGGLSILLYAGTLTLRIAAPWASVDLDAANLVALYLFPSLFLLATALIGRGATGRLFEALGQSEAARRDLAESNQALQEAQAALKATNQKLQVELGERYRAEEALRGSLEETARDQRLLLALSQSAQAVQRAHTPQEVYRSIGDGVKNVGLNAVVCRLVADGQSLEVVHLTFDAGQVARVEQLLGSSLVGQRLPLAPDSPFHRSIARGETILSDSADRAAAEGLSPPRRALASRARALLGSEQAISTPLASGDEVLGLLVVSGSGLGETEKQAVSTFADQAAVALSNLRLFQETRTWAAELERRVEERTTELAASEALYRRLFDSNRDGMFVMDVQGRVLDANPAACQLLGYSREELLAPQALQFARQGQTASPDVHAHLMAQVQEMLHQGGGEYEIEMIHKTGKAVPVEISVTALTYQGQDAALSAARDITERRQAEEELRRLLEEQRTSRARLQRLARQVVTAQEEERHHLSRALHDEAGQALTALKISLNLIAQDLPPQFDSLGGRIADAASLADSTMEGIRRLAQDLRPPALDTVGLNPTLGGYCQDFATRTHLAIDYHGVTLPALPEPADITLYRFLQEALTNVARHANAKRVRVALRQDAESISLSVEDDGRGFDPQAGPCTPGKPPGLGLAGMRERLESLGGHLAIDVPPGQGTRLTAHIPLP